MCDICFSIATFVVLIVLACCPDVRRSFPINFILLGVFVSINLFFRYIGKRTFVKIVVKSKDDSQILLVRIIFLFFAYIFTGPTLFYQSWPKDNSLFYI